MGPTTVSKYPQATATFTSQRGYFPLYLHTAPSQGQRTAAACRETAEQDTRASLPEIMVVTTNEQSGDSGVCLLFRTHQTAMACTEIGSEVVGASEIRSMSPAAIS